MRKRHHAEGTSSRLLTIVDQRSPIKADTVLAKGRPSHYAAEARAWQRCASRRFLLDTNALVHLSVKEIESKQEREREINRVCKTAVIQLSSHLIFVKDPNDKAQTIRHHVQHFCCQRSTRRQILNTCEGKKKKRRCPV